MIWFRSLRWLQTKLPMLFQVFHERVIFTAVQTNECFIKKFFQLGILQPILCHKSGDDRAFMCVKRTSDNGILCYMAVAPDASAIRQ